VYNRTSHALTDIHKSLPNLPSITKAATYLPTYLPTNHHHQGCYIDGVGWKREGRGREGKGVEIFFSNAIIDGSLRI
jgi:hypothetical protein